MPQRGMLARAGAPVVGRLGSTIALWVAAGAFLLLATTTSAATTRFVDVDAPAGGDGSTWATALTSLNDALALSVPGDEVRVAEGTYRPTSGTDQGVSFSLPLGVAIRGGYAGIGSSDPNTRDPFLYVTILSGEIGGAALTDNSLHVLATKASLPAAGPAIVDGATIRDGYADGGAAPESTVGGGVYHPAGELMLIGCTVRNNAATLSGAGIFSKATLTVDGCLITANGDVSANNGVGGGIVSSGGTLLVMSSSIIANVGDAEGAGVAAKPRLDGSITFIGTFTVLDTLFEGNSGVTRGGGLSSNVPGLIERCTFRNHELWFGSNPRGGALHLDGAPCVVRDCLFEDNGSQTGGAVSLSNGGVHRFEHCAFRNNEAFSGGAMSLTGGTCRAEGVLFESNQALSGSSNGPEGGAIYVQASPSPPAIDITLIDCVFVANACVVAGSTSTAEGGAVMLRSSGVIERCRFHGNAARRGGAVAARAPTCTIQNSVFSGNEATISGGAIVAGSVNLALRSSTLAGNTAGTTGAGLAIDAGPINTSISNSILWGNLVAGASPMSANLVESAVGAPDVDYSIIGGLGRPGGAAGGVWGEANHGLDPLFVDLDGSDNILGTVDDDVTLTPNSPALDSGSNALAPRDASDADGDGSTFEFAEFDVAGQPRWSDVAVVDSGCGFASIIDRGAHEFAGTGEAPLFGDLDGSGTLDATDLAILLGSWSPSGAGVDACELADLTLDGFINQIDLAILLGAWETAMVGDMDHAARYASERGVTRPAGFLDGGASVLEVARRSTATGRGSR